jgi:hypothetical protein
MSNLSFPLVALTLPVLLTACGVTASDFAGAHKGTATIITTNDDGTKSTHSGPATATFAAESSEVVAWDDFAVATNCNGNPKFTASTGAQIGSVSCHNTEQDDSGTTTSDHTITFDNGTIALDKSTIHLFLRMTDKDNLAGSDVVASFSFDG